MEKENMTYRDSDRDKRKEKIGEDLPEREITMVKKIKWKELGVELEEFVTMFVFAVAIIISLTFFFFSKLGFLFSASLFWAAACSFIVYPMFTPIAEKVTKMTEKKNVVIYFSLLILVISAIWWIFEPSPPKPISLQSAPITKSPSITIPENAGWMTFKVTSEPQKAIRINGDCVFQYENANQVFLVKETKSGEAVYHNKTTPSCTRRQFKFFNIPPGGVDVYIYRE